MSDILQFEVDPLKISERALQGPLIAMDVLAFSTDEYPTEADDPICIIGMAHTKGLSSVSKVYHRLFVANSASIDEEKALMKELLSYMSMFGNGTLTSYYGIGRSIDEAFDIPYLLARAKDNHRELYPSLDVTLDRFNQHDICQFAKENLNLPSSELDCIEDYYGMARKAEAIISGDVRADMSRYWRDGDTTILKFSLTNLYNCIRIAQSQIKRSICYTDFPL